MRIIKSHKINRKEFKHYIEYVPEDEEFVKDNIEGLIELISPVVKQKKEGKGIPWKGIYYGKDIKEKGIDILLNGEEINFYMQDDNFKKEIKSHNVTFGSGDNIKSIFSLKCLIKLDMAQNKSIYIKEVQKLNDETVIGYKEKVIQDSMNDSGNILSIF